MWIAHLQTRFRHITEWRAVGTRHARRGLKLAQHHIMKWIAPTRLAHGIVVMRAFCVLPLAANFCAPRRNASHTCIPPLLFGPANSALRPNKCVAKLCTLLLAGSQRPSTMPLKTFDADTKAAAKQMEHSLAGILRGQEVPEALHQVSC